MSRSSRTRALYHLAAQTHAACALLAVALIATVGVSSAKADILHEQHVASLTLWDVDLPSTDSCTLSFPKFDTNGGQRTLVGITALYGEEINVSVFIEENLEPHAVASEASFSLTWTGQLNDNPFLPSTAVDEDQVYSLGWGFWAEREAFAPGEVWHTGPSGTQEDILTDQSYFDAFTGDGFIDVESTLAFSEIEYAEPAEGMPPGCEFDPDIMQLGVDMFQFDVTVTYHYTPEPTSLAIMAFGALTLLRRR